MNLTSDLSVSDLSIVNNSTEINVWRVLRTINKNSVGNINKSITYGNIIENLSDPTIFDIEKNINNPTAMWIKNPNSFVSVPGYIKYVKITGTMTEDFDLKFNSYNTLKRVDASEMVCEENMSPYVLVEKLNIINMKNSSDPCMYAFIIGFLLSLILWNKFTKSNVY